MAKSDAKTKETDVDVEGFLDAVEHPVRRADALVLDEMFRRITGWPGYGDFGDILSRLGKHKTGASCLYINKLADVDLDVLEELIRAGLADLEQKWPVTAT